MARVLVLSDLWPPFPGGAERLMFNLSRDLMRRGHDVQVLTSYYQAQAFDGPPVTSVSIGVFDYHDEGAPMVVEAIKQSKAEVVLTHHLFAHQFHEEIASTGVPFVQVVLNGERLPDASLALFISRWVAANGKTRPGDLTFIPPAFDDVVSPEKGTHIGFVKPIPHKGVLMVYELAARLPDRGFAILRGEWQNLEIIQPMNNILFVEPVVDIRDFYRLCRVMLMPSISEDAGTVAQEATMNGMPCISTNVDGLAETNGGGIQLDPDDVDGFVAAIVSLDDPEVYERTVASQRAHLESMRLDSKLEAFSVAIEAVANPMAALGRLAGE